MRRPAFSLVELLVAITIILVLMALLGAAISAARGSGKKQGTFTTIEAIDEILQRHLVNCESRRAGSRGDGATLRRLVTADMPDSWEDVAYMKQYPDDFASARHKGYVATMDAIKPSPDFGDAECLFMIIMQGGLADCLACAALGKARIDDTDKDGAPEFWDEWGNPIRYVLWPGGFELPPGTRFFSDGLPFESPGTSSAPGGVIRPLVFSHGPSGKASTRIHDGSYLQLGNSCGDPNQATIKTLGGFDGGAQDHRGDNITNFDGVK